MQNSAQAPETLSQREQVQAQIHQMQAQRQAMLWAQAQAKGMQGQPAGYSGPLPAPQSPAMGTLNTPIQRPLMQMTQQRVPQILGGPSAGLQLNRENPSLQAGEIPDRKNLLAAMMRNLPPATLQNFRLMPPERQNEYLDRLMTSRQLRGLSTGPAQSPSASGSDVVRPRAAAASNPSPTTAKALSGDLPPVMPPGSSSRNQGAETPTIRTEEESDSGDGVVVRFSDAQKSEEADTGRRLSDTPDLIDLDTLYTGTASTRGDHSIAGATPQSPSFDSVTFDNFDSGANDPWLPLFPEKTSEMPPPPSSYSTSVRGNRVEYSIHPQQQQAAATVEGKEVEESPEVSLPFIGYSFKRFGPEWSMENEVAAFAADNRPRGSPSGSVPAESTSAPSGVSGRRRDKPLPPIIFDDSDEVIAMKRARNTLAARKSRERKAQRLDDLIQKIAALEKERNQWKEAFLAKGQNDSQEQKPAGASTDDGHG